MQIQDVEKFIEFLRQDSALRQRVLEALLTEEFLQLPAIVKQLVAQVEKLVEQMQRLTERQERLEERQERLEERQERLEESHRRLEATLQHFIETTDRRFEEVDRRFDQVDRRFDQVDRRFDRVEGRLDRAEIRLDRVEGWALEERYDRQAYAYFGRRLRRIRVVPKAELDELLSGRLPAGDLEELFRADVVLRGRPKEGPEAELYLVLEVSATIDLEDVERAARRAQVLRNAGLACVAAVGGVQAAERALEVASLRRVAVALDGRLEGWDEAAAAA